jgi:hypothetical protein
MHSSWRKADHYPTEILFFLRLGGPEPHAARDLTAKFQPYFGKGFSVSATR